MRFAVFVMIVAGCLFASVSKAADAPATLAATAPAVDDRDAAILKAAGVDADAKGVMTYLSQIRSSPETTKMVADLVKQLGAADWKAREVATGN